MSRSYRKPCIKDRSPKHNRRYNKVYRTNWNRITRSIMKDDEIEEADYPNKLTIINQWDICDWNWKFLGEKLGNWHDDWRKRLTRK